MFKSDESKRVQPKNQSEKSEKEEKFCQEVEEIDSLIKTNHFDEALNQLNELSTQIGLEKLSDPRNIRDKMINTKINLIQTKMQLQNNQLQNNCQPEKNNISNNNPFFSQ